MKSFFSKKRKHKAGKEDEAKGKDATKLSKSPIIKAGEDSGDLDDGKKVDDNGSSFDKMKCEGSRAEVAAGGGGGGLYPSLLEHEEMLNSETEGLLKDVSSPDAIALGVVDFGKLDLSGPSSDRKSPGIDASPEKNIYNQWQTATTSSHLPSPPGSRFEIESVPGVESKATDVADMGILNQDVRPTPKACSTAVDSSVGLPQESPSNVTFKAAERKVEEIIASSGYTVDQIVEAIQFLDQQKRNAGNFWQMSKPYSPSFLCTPPVFGQSTNVRNTQPNELAGSTYWNHPSGVNVRHPSENDGAYGYTPGAAEVPLDRRELCNSDDEKLKT